MKFTHAIISRIPSALKFPDKKQASKTDLALARKEQEDFNDTLREVSFSQYFNFDNSYNFILGWAGID
jgi:hypothetical protein